MVRQTGSPSIRSLPSQFFLDLPPPALSPVSHPCCVWHATGRLYSSSVQDTLDQLEPLCWQVQRTRGTTSVGQAALNNWLSGMGIWKLGSSALHWGDFELEHPPQTSPAGLGWCFLPWTLSPSDPCLASSSSPFCSPHPHWSPPGVSPSLLNHLHMNLHLRILLKPTKEHQPPLFLHFLFLNMRTIMLPTL